MPVASNLEAGHGGRGGAFAGVVGGLAMTVLGLFSAIARGDDLWPGLKGAAYPIVGQIAVEPGFNAGLVLLGTLIHFAVAVAIGVGFGLVFYGLSRGMTLVSGALYGVVVWLVMYYAVLPLAGMGFVAESVPLSTAVLGHVVFGLAVAIGFLPYQREKIISRSVSRGSPSRTSSSRQTISISRP
jgi:hypothetical protein